MSRPWPQLSGWYRPLRWLVLGVATTGLNFGLLYLLVDQLGISFVFAPLISAEVCIVLRFLGNDRWVFGHARPTWRRLGQYHAAVAGGFVVWWAASNCLVQVGLHYLLAALLAIGCSVVLNLITNFHWIWCDRRPGGDNPSSAAHDIDSAPPR